MREIHSLKSPLKADATLVANLCNALGRSDKGKPSRYFFLSMLDAILGQVFLGIFTSHRCRFIRSFRWFGRHYAIHTLLATGRSFWLSFLYLVVPQLPANYDLTAFNYGQTLCPIIDDIYTDFCWLVCFFFWLPCPLWVASHINPVRKW